MKREQKFPAKSPLYLVSNFQQRELRSFAHTQFINEEKLKKRKKMKEKKKELQKINVHETKDSQITMKAFLNNGIHQ